MTILIIITLILLFVAIVYAVYQNSKLVVTETGICDENIPEGFDGFKIAHLSDLHNCSLGEGNINLVNILKESDCDIIVMTGDMIDSRRTNINVTIDFISEAVKIAPCYYVNGNHEARLFGTYENFRDEIEKMGVTVLENKAITLERNDCVIDLIGLNDTGFDLGTSIDYYLDKTMPEGDNYKILLAHRPEYFELYEGVDLILSGHAHGGQIRLPVIGGVYAPGQGLFPKYDSGVYHEGEMTMVVSRGLGGSAFPLRINNNPEVVFITLEKE